MVKLQHTFYLASWPFHGGHTVKTDNYFKASLIYSAALFSAFDMKIPTFKMFSAMLNLIILATIAFPL